MKIILNYDPETGSITDKNGTYIGGGLGVAFEPLEVGRPEGGPSVNELCELKQAGFNAGEIIDLTKQQII